MFENAFTFVIILLYFWYKTDMWQIRHKILACATLDWNFDFLKMMFYTVGSKISKK